MAALVAGIRPRGLRAGSEGEEARLAGGPAAPADGDEGRGGERLGRGASEGRRHAEEARGQAAAMLHRAPAWGRLGTAMTAAAGGAAGVAR